METKMVSELQKNNKVTIQAHLISVLVVAIFFFLQVTDGLVSPVYAVVMTLIGMAPIIAEKICWKRNKEEPEENAARGAKAITEYRNRYKIAAGA